MEKTQTQKTSWKGDPERDTVTYRLIELSLTLMETAFTEDERLSVKYDAWINKVKANETGEEPEPVVIYPVDDEDGNRLVTVFATPNEDEFFILYETEGFKASVSLEYDREGMDIRGAFVEEFSGDASVALGWIGAFKATLDDALVSDVLQQDEEE